RGWSCASLPARTTETPTTTGSRRTCRMLFRTPRGVSGSWSGMHDRGTTSSRCARQMARASRRPRRRRSPPRTARADGTLAASAFASRAHSQRPPSWYHSSAPISTGAREAPMARAEVNGYEIHYEISGGGSGGPDVLWVHGGYGGLQSRYAPRTHFPDFDGVARNFQAARRNCYRSETRVEPYTLDDTIDDLRQLLEVARAETGGFERPILIGSSAGGPPALG